MANNLIVLFGIPRTGSNNICSLISQSSNIILNSEDFNGKLGIRCMDSKIKSFIKKEANIKTDEELQEFLTNHPETYLELLNSYAPEKFKLFKFFYGHLPNKLILQTFLKCKKIILKRDYLECYVSNKIAEKTNKWYNYDTTHHKIKINFNDLEKNIIQWENYYSLLQENVDENTIIINYNDLSELSSLEQYKFLKSKLETIGIFLQEKNMIRNKFIKQSKTTLENQILNYNEIMNKYKNLFPDLKKEYKCRSNIQRYE